MLKNELGKTRSKSSLMYSSDKLKENSHLNSTTDFVKIGSDYEAIHNTFS